MNGSNTKAGEPERLRREAEGHLREGTSPPTHGWVVGSDALTRLYDLASDPDRAADALKVLHELQAYQVELDLQYQQYADNESELAGEAVRYKALFEYAPIGYLVISLEGWIIQSNHAGAELFAAAPADLAGQRIDSFLALDNRRALASPLLKLRAGQSKVSTELRLALDSDTTRVLHADATLAPDGSVVLMTVFAADSPASS